MHPPTKIFQKAYTAILALAVLFPLQPAKTTRSLPQADPGFTLNLLRSDRDGVLIELVTQGYQLSPMVINGESYDLLSLDGAIATSGYGKPQLPQVSKLIGVPPGAELQMRVLSEDAVPLDGSYRLLPVPSPALEQVSQGDEIQPGAEVYAPDAAAYASLQPYPATAARLSGDAWLRDRRIARVELFPFQYIPAQGRLYWRKRLLVEVSFVQPSAGASLQQLSTPAGTSADNLFDASFHDLLLNEEAARSWRGKPGSASRVMDAAAAVTPMSEPAYRIPIERDGLYRLTYQNLKDAGLDVDSLDPNNFHLSSQGQDVAYYLYNPSAENRFDPGEYLAFYGQKFYGERLAALYQAEDDHWLSFNSQDISGTYTTWTPHMNASMLEQYTDENVYWLSVGTSPGLHMPEISGAPGGASIAQNYPETVHEEKSGWWVANQSWTLFASEDNWLWMQNKTFDPAGTTWVYTTTLSAVASGSYSATLRGEVVSVSGNNAASPDHHTEIYLNDSAHVQPVDDKSWDGQSRYHFDAQLDQSILVNGVNALDFVAYKTPALAADELYFDWFEIQYNRSFIAMNNEITFSPAQAGSWRYRISGYSTSPLGVLDITNPLSPVWITDAQRNFDVLDFQVSHTQGARFFAGKYSDIPASVISFYDPPDISQEAQYLVITHPDFQAPAQRLADYRQTKGLSARVISVLDLYNQFNFGIFNPIAIKNFLKYTFETWSNPPLYAVLVGDGNWNFKGSARYNKLPNYMPPNLAWIDPWSGVVDSANLLAAVVGDDILPDLYISRIPVNSALELDHVVDKTIAYESYPRADWQRNLLFIADNVPDPNGAGDFVQFSDQIIADYLEPGFTAQRIYENDYNCPFNNLCPAVTNQITTTMNITGSLIVNYVGHAAVNRWSNESAFGNANIADLANGEMLPVILSMTCLDGYWIHPGYADPNSPYHIYQSLIEDMLRADGKGMVASFSPSGFGVTTGHDWLHRGFYEALFRQGAWQLGQAAGIARLYLYATGSNLDLVQTYTVFGDPALWLLNPYDVYLPVIAK